MASNTPNLKLLKKSPVTDGDDLFNVDTMLNENWDKIDKNAGELKQTLAALTQTVNSKARSQVITYVGTGMYGVENPTNVTFSFNPSFIFVMGHTASNYQMAAFASVRGAEMKGYMQWGEFKIDKISFLGRRVSWSSSSSAMDQANGSGVSYSVFGIE